MTYMLDTDTCSYIIKRPHTIRKKLSGLGPEDIAISAITWAELNSWISTSSNPLLQQLSLQKMFAPINILPFTPDDGYFHGAIHKHLATRGRLIGALDMLIAAHAISRNLIVVTNNTKHFGRIPNLKIENWFEK